MAHQAIRLRGISGDVKGRVWESDSVLRAGRLTSLEITLDDQSVSRRHAEVRRGDTGWYVRDLNSTNGTYVNGIRVANQDHPLRPRDILQFGKVAMIVELEESSFTPQHLMTTQQVLASASANFEEGLRRIAFTRDEMPRAGEQLVALLRAGHHFHHTSNEDQLLDAILHDAVSVLDAQRGAIVLAEDDGPEPKLRLRALAVGHGETGSRFHYSKRLTQRCFARGESVLYTHIDEDDELKLTQSIADGAMASVLCVLLRTPRRRLGVLHLDRSFWQNPFTEDDLLLADALAAHVSAAIESAQLLQKQKDLFLNTIMILAQAVELRDGYTGGHTQRVTRYATLLAQEMQLPTEQIELIKLGTPLHDIGKIGIDDSILRKPGRLTAQEFAIMQTHTTMGAEILSTITEMQPIIPIVRNHHERWDGTGYPDRLQKGEIPLLARIVAVADAFDAMTSHRPYHLDRQPKSPEDAFAEVERQSGRQFDPQAAAAFLNIKDQVMATMVQLMPDMEIPASLSASTPAPIAVPDPSTVDEWIASLPDPRD